MSAIISMLRDFAPIVEVAPSEMGSAYMRQAADELERYAAALQACRQYFEQAQHFYPRPADEMQLLELIDKTVKGIHGK